MYLCTKTVVMYANRTGCLSTLENIVTVWGWDESENGEARHVLDKCTLPDYASYSVFLLHPV